MGVRGEVFSSKVILPNRTYFFNVKENRMGDLYLNIVESKNRDNGGFERQSVILFADDLQEFLKGFDESLKVLEKSVREKKHSGGKPVKREEGQDQERDRKNNRAERRHPNSFKEKGAGNRGSEQGKSRFKPSSEKNARSRRSERGEKSRFKPTGEKGAGNRGGERDDKSRFKPAGDKNFRSRGERGSDNRSRDSKKVVVKRRDQKPDR